MVVPTWLHLFLFPVTGIAAWCLTTPFGGPAALGARVLVATTGLWLAGGAIEQGLGWTERTLPFHRLVLGQVGLIAYAYLRSALTHVGSLPGLSPWELWIGLLVLGALGLRHRPALRDQHSHISLAWLAWWASLFVFLAMRAWDLNTPSSDTDAHAYFARLFDSLGAIPYDHQPYSDDPVHYPSGFVVLNGLWMILSGASAVQVINNQATIQACLAVGLILEAAWSLQPRPSVAVGLLVIGAAHFVFVFPVNTEHIFLDGTPRLAHTALLLLPLTMAFCARATERARYADTWVVIACLAFAAAWAVATNPARALVLPPVGAAACFWLLTTRRDQPTPDSVARRWFWAVAVAVPILLLASDGWLRVLVFPPPAVGPPAPPPPSDIVWGTGAISAMARWASAHQTGLVFPIGCAPGPHCPGYLVGVRALGPPVAYFCAIALLLALRWKRNLVPWRNTALAVLTVGLFTWLTVLAAGLMDGLIPHPMTRNMSLLREYTINGLRFASPYAFLLLASFALVAAHRLAAHQRASPGIVVVGLSVALVATTAWRNPRLVFEATSHYLRLTVHQPPSPLGAVEPIDIDLAEQIDAIVPRGERVLLAGMATQNQYEHWNYALGPSRAIPLYSDTHFAFFLGLGPSAASAPAYRERVCNTLDLSWLRDQLGVSWVFVSDAAFDQGACIYNWHAIRDDYFEEALRVRGRALYRLQASPPLDPATDPRLRPALPAFTPPHGNVVGHLDGCAPDRIEGWSCAVGSPEPVTVEIVAEHATQIPIVVLVAANRPRSQRVARECESDAHGFEHRPTGLSPGTYRLRVSVPRDADWEPALLGTCPLAMPVRKPRPHPSGTSEMTGYVDVCRSTVVQGWSCAREWDHPVVIGLSVSGVGISTRRSFFLADQDREQSIAHACATDSTRHGFDFVPPPMPAGEYHARVVAYDPALETQTELRTCTMFFSSSANGGRPADPPPGAPRPGIHTSD